MLISVMIIIMITPFSPEIRQIQHPDDPLFYYAKRVNDASHRFALKWLDLVHHNFVAVDPDRDKVVGVIQTFDPVHGEDYGERHIFRLAVDKNNYRRRGIGSLLVSHVVGLAREEGLSVMSTQPESEAAGALFRKLGFESCRQSSKWYFRYLKLNPAKAVGSPSDETNTIPNL